MIAITAEILDATEQRTLHLLAGLEVPEYGAIYRASYDGTTTLVREAPPLPGGRELLAQALEAGYSPRERAVQVGAAAAIAELLAPLAEPAAATQAGEEPTD